MPLAPTGFAANHIIMGIHRLAIVIMSSPQKRSSSFHPGRASSKRPNGKSQFDQQADWIGRELISSTREGRHSLLTIATPTEDNSLRA